MTKILRGLRGATTARANTSEAILQATAELLRALLEANGFQPEDVESAIFTSSPDLTAEYPARAARLLGWRDVPLLGAAEVPVADGLPGTRGAAPRVARRAAARRCGSPRGRRTAALHPRPG